MPGLEGVVHGKQTRLLCGVYAVRALLQQNVPKDALFRKAKELEKDPKTKPFGPHYTRFLGNFSFDTINFFIQEYVEENDFVFEVYHPEEPITDYSVVKGFLINVKCTIGRHWLAVRRLGCLKDTEEQFPFYNLDSKLSEPKLIGEVEIFPFLENLRKEKDAVFYILKNK